MEPLPLGVTRVADSARYPDKSRTVRSIGGTMIDDYLNFSIASTGVERPARITGLVPVFFKGIFLQGMAAATTAGLPFP
jgi:hypothetical protein